MIPVMGDGTIELDPIHVDDVCAAMIEALENDRVLGHTYDLLGPERVTFNQFLDRLSTGLGVKRRRLHIPGPVALALARGLAAITRPRPPARPARGRVPPARCASRSSVSARWGWCTARCWA